MGAQLSLLAQTAPSIAISSYIDVLDEVHYQTQLNASRFLKTCKAIASDGEIVVKVFIKPTDNYDLNEIHEKVEKQSTMLTQLPNVLNYSKIFYTDRAGYLIRQHLKTNLYDRTSMRPFLQNVELKFMAFQLLHILSDIHTRDIVHGDIKTENIMVTSSNWVVLTDFSEYIKPKYLPEDNPGEYAFYFDTSQRRSCYLAPERFNTQQYNIQTDHKLDKEMDIFSCGCCIFEMFTEGRPLFNLAELFKYKNKEINPTEWLKREINDEHLLNLILDMIAIDPNSRLSARNLLTKYRGKFFPDSFYSFTYEYTRDIISSNENICTNYARNINTRLSEKNEVLDRLIEKVHRDFPKICISCNFPMDKLLKNLDTDPALLTKNVVKLRGISNIKLLSYDKIEDDSVKNQSSLIFISILLHCLRNLCYPRNKQKCLEMILILSQYISDANKLDRVLPFICVMLFDDSVSVRGTAIQVLSQLLTLVETVSHSNGNVFVDYIMPRLCKLCHNKSSSYVKMILANSLSDFATSAMKFHEISYITRAQESNVFELNQLQKSRKKLTRQFQDIAINLLTAQEYFVKEALLSNILPICNLFGRERTNDIILSHLITYLNDKNSSLRISLVQSITGVSILLGPVAFEQYILPLLTQTLTDADELVVVNVLQGLNCFCKIGLLRTRYFYDIAIEVAPLMLHPNFWIRQFTITLIITMSSRLTNPELYCMMYPIIKSYFEFEVEFSWESMSTSCKKPISRNVYELLCTWSLRASKSFFWKQIPNKILNSFGNNTIEFITKNFTSKNYGLQSDINSSKSHIKSIRNEEIPLTTEDKTWIDKIKAVGLSETELWKIAVLRPYVFRVAKMLSRKPDAELIDFDELPEDKKNYGLPRNVFFDIELLDSAQGRDTHVVLKRQFSKDVLSFKKSSPQILQRPVDMNGSLILTPKSNPVINSSFENVYVQFEPNSLPNSSEIIEASAESTKSKFNVVHSYQGEDNFVLKFLQSIQVRPSLKRFKEFGLPVMDQNLTSSLPTSMSSLKLLSSLTDHKPAAVVKLIANRYKPYFISASNYGVLKVWDLLKIEKGSTFKPVVNYEIGSSITTLSFVERYDVFYVTTKDGSLQLLKIRFKNHREDLAEIEGVDVIRKFNYDDPKEYAVTSAYTKSDSDPCIITTTNMGNIVLIDIRDMSIISAINVPPQFGAVISSSLSEDGIWLLCGTAHGHSLLWNLTFKLLVKSWRFEDGIPITKVIFHPRRSKKYEYDAIIVGGSKHCLFSIWNLSRVQAEEVVSSREMTPSIESFTPKFGIEKGKEILPDFLERDYISDFLLAEDVIFYADSLTSEIYRYDLINRTSTPLLSKETPEKAITTKMTLNCSLTTIGKPSDKIVRQRASYFHKDLITSIALSKISSGSVLISSDNSGVINLYYFRPF